ncbi:hypothetical protein, conserved [Eimeria maxima]|uniref:Uncharacterized protein n=1 Tax=Eimeria maxima TaxID=5804 RepID=U6MJ74_EIMMA|nr:hypothetical protein, conserved [Eimeria maxima]CDJ61700.1 hypothetical protein, conserved [Eimeria maxima]
MGLEGFAYPIQQRLRSFIECYRSISLYHRNLGFFCVGILGGSIWGSYERRGRDAANADCSAVRLTFYDLPAALSQPQQDSRPSNRERTDRQRKRAFENLWEEAARLLQRQPGYTYTQMFRRALVDEVVENAEQSNMVDAKQQRHRVGRKGVSAGIQFSNESEGAKREQQSVDYVELRVWESEESRSKADMLQTPLVQKIQELGVKMDAGLYRRVFDDALVRLIQ